MTELVRYEAARRALAEAVAVDEVLEIRDEWEAIRLAGLVAKDVELQLHAAKIRFRAERRLGELVREQKRTVGLAKGGQPYQSEREQVERPATLAEAGIDRKLSARAQRIADMGAEEFEGALVQHETEMRSSKGRISMDLTKVAAEEKGREHRRGVAQALSDASALQPSGRKYPVIYADPPWHRNQGVTSRSYENHYPTMSWSDICALPVADMVLPDAWLFLWIPRAHLLAWHEAEVEATDLRTGEVIKVRAPMPLASAVALSWGFEAYSTAFVWTKNDEEHPDEAGGAVLVRDQDELLLLFKRGNGLPKPAGGEKFGSNHRERSRPLGHSRKPEHYRRMIATMSGGVPALELFARVDAEHPLPAGWHAWGNQASATNSLAKADDSPAPEGAQAGVEASVCRASDGRSSDEGAPSHGGAPSQIADAGEIAGARPALSADVASAPIGTVVSVVADLGRADTAAPPAKRPGRVITDDDLEIPAFLRRTPAPAAILHHAPQAPPELEARAHA